MSIFCFLMIQRYIAIQKINYFEYSILILLALLGIFFICSSNDLITAYLSIELQSLSFYVMAAMKKDSSFSIDAGLKYFILGAFSSSLFLFGSSILYGISCTINFEDLKKFFISINSVYYNTQIFNTFLEASIVQIALVFIFSSFLFKLPLYLASLQLLFDNNNNDIRFDRDLRNPSRTPSSGGGNPPNRNAIIALGASWLGTAWVWSSRVVRTPSVIGTTLVALAITVGVVQNAHFVPTVDGTAQQEAMARLSEVIAISTEGSSLTFQQASSIETKNSLDAFCAERASIVAVLAVTDASVAEAAVRGTQS